MYEEYDPGDACFSFFSYWEWGVKTIFIFRSKMTLKPQKDIEI